jgi:hypothetical protein
MPGEEQQSMKRKWPSFGSRAEMEKFEKELPHHVQEELKKGKLRYADTIIYSVKPLASKTIKMFETHDDRDLGLRNIANAKLQKNQCLLITGIQVYLFSPNVAGPTATKDEILNASTQYIEDCRPLVNGEFSLKANQKTIIPETSCRIFPGQTQTGVQIGYYKLHNPRLVVDEVLLEFTFELGTWSPSWKNSHVFVGLHGTITTP